MPNMSDARNWFAPVAVARKRRFSASSRHGNMIEVDGRLRVNFAANDYLGLSFHPDVQQAAIDSIKARGVGSGASRLVSGDDPSMHALEQALADWKGYEACLIAGSGMLANIGLLQALAGRHSHIFSDKLNHASLLDGARLSGAVQHRFAHRDMDGLASLLAKHPARQRIIVSDGVFSMDGDCADVRRLLELAEAHDALLLIDDAHGIGTVGDGRGLVGAAGIHGHARLIEVGTFGKAFGSYGAFILGCRELIEGLRQHQRTMIYSTALPPALIAAASASLALIRQGDLVGQLQKNIARFRSLAAELPLMDSSTAIQPLLIGEDAAALRAAEVLRDAGFFVPAIRPPTVPEGTSRLRITLSAAHDAQQIEGLCSALRRLA
ncbi:MAG: 8-amino-7-oxononanoate synthase [Mariprofundaceae bacterium]